MPTLKKIINVVVIIAVIVWLLGIFGLTESSQRFILGNENFRLVG